MENFRLISCLTVVLVFAVGCGDCGVADPPGEMQRADVEPATHQEFDGDERAAAGEMMRGFGLELLQAARDEQQAEQVMVAPYTTLSLLVQLYAGAGGDTRGQFVEALGFQFEDERLHELFAEVQGEFDRQEAHGDFTLHGDAQLWAPEEVSFADQYLQVLATNYGDGVRTLEFDDESLRQLNAWLTHGSGAGAEEVVEPGQFQDGSLVGTSSAWMDARWQYGFERLDSPESFTTGEGERASVEMMRGDQMYRFARHAGTLAVSMRYQDTNVAFFAMMPSQEDMDFDQWFRDLDGEQFERVVHALSGLQEGEVVIPRFDLTATLDLQPVLEAMGLQAPFDAEDADFSRLAEDDEPPVVVQQLRQMATLNVHEHGGRVATDEERQEGGVDAGPGPDQVHFNRPFVFAVYDQASEVPLFLGVYEGPVNR